MKNAKIKKILACVLTATCVSSLLAGCGNTEKTGESSAKTENSSETQKEESKAEESTDVVEETGITYPIEGDVTLTVGMLGMSQITSQYKDLADTPFGKALQEATGVTLEINQYDSDSALSLMLASGELPDIVLMGDFMYNGGPAKAIKDGIFEPLNEYVEYCPDLMKVLNSNETYMKSVTTAEGDIIGFPNLRGDDYLLTSCGMIIRQDFLDKLDADLPATPDELYEVLKGFKEELGVETPFAPTFDYLFYYGIEQGIMTSPFDLVKGDFYVDNGQVHYGYYENQYKDVLTYLKKLYDEKLLDNNFATIDVATARANFMNGVSGTCIDTPGGGMGGFLSTMKDDPEFDCSGFGPLVAKEGDLPMSTHYGSPYSGYSWYITTTSENKEAAAKFLNYAYTEAGHMLYNFGIEGVSYEMIDGYPTYTDLIMNNPNGLTKQQAMAGYVRSWTSCGYVQDRRYMEQYSNLPQQQQALTQWTTSDAAKYQYPSVEVADADLAEYSKIIGDASTYIIEMTIKYITGAEDLADFESEYLTTLKEMGMDRVLEMKQAAYEEYQSR